MSEEFDPFKGSSGLMDDVDVKFTNFRFGRNPQYKDQDGNLLVVAMVDMVTDEETKDQILSIGKGWEIDDNGAKVVRENGEPKGFNNSTYLQTILNTCLDLDEDAMRKRYEDTGLAPQQAGYWEGLVLHMEQQDYQSGFGDSAATRQRLMPVEVKGWDAPAKTNGSAKKAPAKKAAAKKAAAAAPVAEVVEDTPAETGGAELAKVKLQIRNIADEVETFDEFVDRCFAEIAGIADNVAIQALVEDDEAGSIWADAVEAAS